MFCQNPYITFLKERGYNIVRLPRSDFYPLLLLAREGERDLSQMGRITELLVDAEPPVTHFGVPAAGISGKRTNVLNASIGLDILGTLLGAMGGGQIGLNAKFGKTRGVSFEFPEVLSDRIDIIDLDKYLAKGVLTPDTRYVSGLLDRDELYVVTDVIKSRKFSIDIGSSGSAGAEVSVPAIQQVVGAKIRVSGEVTESTRIYFEGDTPLVFGFQARRLIYDGGNYLRVEPVLAGTVTAKSADDLLSGKTIEDNMLMTKGPWVNLR
jgi:hypothetical protein